MQKDMAQLTVLSQIDANTDLPRYVPSMVSAVSGGALLPGNLFDAGPTWTDQLAAQARQYMPRETTSVVCLNNEAYGDISGYPVYSLPREEELGNQRQNTAPQPARQQQDLPQPTPQVMHGTAFGSLDSANALASKMHDTQHATVKIFFRPVCALAHTILSFFNNT